MEYQIGNSKRIVTNTIVLYVRMFIVMLISLYSSRLVLKALGVDDYGLYNVVGGVVALTTFLKTSLASSTQRFLSFEIGKGDKERTRAVFSVSLTTHLVIAFIILVLSESLGLWFLNSQINIPEGREFAANMVYQLSVLSLIVSMICLPYNANVISREKMNFFAVIGIVEAFLKLFFAFLLLYIGIDKLIMYGILTTVLTIVVNASYWWYCRINFEEARFILSLNKTLFKEIFSFSGWTILGQMAVVGVSYGTGIIINLFFPVAVNAAMGIAQQVNGAITGLTSNFQTAFQPQITKSYASKDYSYFNSLLCYSAKISFFLLFIVAFPIVLNMDSILNLWLSVVPEYASEFCIFFIISSIFNALSAPLWIAIFATGKIKYYQIVVSLVFFSELFLIYLLFKLDFQPVTCMIVKAIINFVIIFVRLAFANKLVISFSGRDFLLKAILPCFLVVISSMFILMPLIPLLGSGILKLIISCLAILIAFICSYYLGLNKAERKSAVSLVLKVIKR